MTYFYVFLAGFAIGSIVVFILTHKSSAKVKALKAEAESEYQTKIAAIEKERTQAVTDLEAKKIILANLTAQLDSMTPGQAKDKLTPDTQGKIDDVADQTVDNIMAKVKAASNP